MKESCAYLPVDNNGMLGRQCQRGECAKFFKINVEDYGGSQTTDLFCPHCGVKKCGRDMVAEEQYEYYFDLATSEKAADRLNEFFKNFKRRLQGAKEINIPPIPQEGDTRRYGDKEPRRIIPCKNCNKRYAVYFTSFFCPFCRYRDLRLIYDQEIEVARAIADLYDERSDTDMDILEKNRLDDNLAEKSLISIITAFETYCKSKYVAKVAEGSSESEALDKIKNSFQNLTKADKLLSKFGIDIRGVIDTDPSFLQGYFEKRHIFVHNSGIIDQNFIDNTQEDQSSLGQRLVFHKSELLMLISGLEKIVSEIENKLK